MNDDGGGGFYVEPSSSRNGWKIHAIGVVSDEREAKGLQSVWRAGRKGSGLQVRTKRCNLRALGAALSVWVVIVRSR